MDATTANCYLTRGRIASSVSTTMKGLLSASDYSLSPAILSKDNLTNSVDVDKQTFPRDLVAMEKLNKTIFADRSSSKTELDDGINGLTGSSPATPKESSSVQESADDSTCKRKRSHESSIDDTKDEPLRKRQQTTPTQNFQSKKPGMTKDSGMGTHLYIASDALKKHRWAMGPNIIRKLGRSPWKLVDNQSLKINDKATPSASA